MSFSRVSGYPSWEDYIPSLKIQTLIMCIMAKLAYQVDYKLTGAVVNEFNEFTALGSMIFFNTKGEYTVINPECGADRVRLSYPDGSLVSQYYQYPIPGIDPTLLKPDIQFDYAKDYKIGLPPVYGTVPPIYNEVVTCPIPWVYGQPMPPPEETIVRCVPNPGQPFFNQSKLTKSISRNVFGYYKPPPSPSPDAPYVIAFHCLRNYIQSSNNPFDTLQYFQFQTILIRWKGVAPYTLNNQGVLVDRYNNPVNEEGYFIDRDGETIPIMTYLNEVDYFPTVPNPSPPPDEIPNLTFGYNLTYNSFVFSFRGSTYLPDFLGEFIPPEILIADLQLANPKSLLDRYRPWLVNKATSMYKAIATATNFDYFTTPFPEEQSIRINKNYSVYMGTLCFTGHSYGGSLSNILAQYLVDRFPVYMAVQTYAFAPVPYVRKCAPPLDGLKYSGSLLIRGFVNDNDVVPFLKVPNFLNEDQQYLQFLYPPELYGFYHIKSANSSCDNNSDSCQKSNNAILERINGYCFPNGGVPAYLAINKDHILDSYIQNIKNIDEKQFEDTIFDDFGIINYTVTNEEVIKTLIASIPVFLQGAGSATSIFGVSFFENPVRFLYNFIGFNEIDVNYLNLIESLRLGNDVNDCSDPNCNVTRCCLLDGNPDHNDDLVTK